MSNQYHDDSIQENIVNIAMKAAELIKDNKIQADDIDGHVGMTQTIVRLAKQFEEKYAGTDWELPFTPDYWEEIDKFAEEHLMEQYAIEAKENTVTLWARVGMTLEVTPETYERLKMGDRNALQAVFDGTAGHARLDGETYFPDTEVNVGLEDMEFDLPVRSAKAAPQLTMPENTGPVKVYAVAGTVKHELYCGTLDECKKFCNDHDWAFMDENRFIWELELEDSRDLPEGYYDALAYYSKTVGKDIETNFVVEHAAELVYCHEHDKKLVDFDFWTQYEALLGEKISFDEYIHIDANYEEDPLDIQPDDEKTIAFLRADLAKCRSVAKHPQSLDDKIQSAQIRQTQQEKNSQKEPER